MNDAERFLIRCKFALLVIGMSRHVGVKEAECIFYNEYNGRPKLAVDTELAKHFGSVA